ncbi:unnamed protein product [Camellia sinensis]
MNLDGENSTRFEKSEGTRTNVDLERESSGVEEGELNRVKDGLNLLPLGGNEVFSGGRPGGGGGGGGVAAFALGLAWIVCVLLTEQFEEMQGLFTVFVDNLPGATNAESLFKLFTKFGIVKNVFIPLKRRIVSKSRFGFVRFDCPVAADIAIQQANGMLVDDMVLQVKKATHARGNRDDQNRGLSQNTKRFFTTTSMKGKAPYVDQRSFAEVLKGEPPTAAGNVSMNIKVDEVGHGWLYDSVIIRLNAKYSTHDIGKALKANGLDQVLVRQGGGCDVVLTFKSSEELKSNICNIKDWFKDWSQFVVEWKPDFHYEQERCLWLRCYGIPLNCWNRNTLNSIGSIWGSVLNLDGDICQPKSFSYAEVRVVTSCMEPINKTILLECKGKVHPILVCEDHSADLSIMKLNGMEDCSSNVLCSSKEAETFLEKGCREYEDDDEVAAGCDKLAVELVYTNEVVPRKEPTACRIGKKANTVVEETKLDSESCSKEGAYVEVMMLEEPMHSPKSNDGNQRCVEQVFTQGFMKSFSGSREGLQPGINLEVDLAQSISNNLVSDPFSRPIEPCNVKPGCNGLLALCLNHSGHIRQSAAISKPLRNVKKKGKQKAHLEGFTTFSRLHGYKAVNKPTSKSIIYRPAAAAIAQSELSESESSLNNYLLQEATATIQLGKTLGINFNGQEDVALNKIMDLERKDKKRIIKEGKVKQ